MKKDQRKDYVTNIRTNRDEKEQVDEILQSLGLTFSSVINLLMKQIILTKGVPFPVVMPSDNDSGDVELRSGSELLRKMVEEREKWDERDDLYAHAKSLAQEAGLSMRELEKPGDVSFMVLDKIQGTSDLEKDSLESDETAGVVEGVDVSELEVSQTEPIKEELFIEQSYGVSFDEVVDSVSDTETPLKEDKGDVDGSVSSDGVSDVSIENKDVVAGESGSSSKSDESEGLMGEFESIFDAFQSMNIKE